MKNIAVFFGGMSVEHDVSVITGEHSSPLPTANGSIMN